jgi:hypothetical protein
MKVLVATTTVAIVLACLLLWKNPPVPRNVYRAAFLAALGVFFVFLAAPESSWMIRSGRGALGTFTAACLIMISATPYLVLVEAGLAGYKGFTSWLRYLSLTVAGLGTVALVTSILLPRLLRRGEP